MESIMYAPFSNLCCTYIHSFADIHWNMFDITCVISLWKGLPQKTSAAFVFSARGKSSCQKTCSCTVLVWATKIHREFTNSVVLSYLEATVLLHSFHSLPLAIFQPSLLQWSLNFEGGRCDIDVTSVEDSSRCVLFSLWPADLVHKS